ncbi:hypothetical protein [Pseudalkalibacillus sp. SCS-8]|uniref:hypothetical protein n=1 Tax=Pseudalkalibacillus nanhaiensis TaxID=3115291 RepID=UPI0032D9CC60
MKKFISKTIKYLTILGILSSSLVFTNISASAALEADARYRDGGLANAYNHAGLRRAGIGIYEIKGYNHEIELSTWDSFLNGQTYLGAYYNPDTTSTDKDYILYTAKAMDADPEITYTMYDALAYESNPGSYVAVDEISDIRCDGVVEYAYEWNYVWVWGKTNDGTKTGTPTNFDISYVPYVSEHANLGDEGWFELSPIVQRGAKGTKYTQLVKY